MRLYLVRHGWTQWHSEGRIAGWADVPLDDRGRAEAQAAGYWLARPGRLPAPAILSSPVLRARQTAELIAAAFQPPRPVEMEPGIAETLVQDWEGQLADEIVASDPRWQGFHRAPADFRFGGGETGREVQERAVAAVEALRRAGRQDQDIILVAHADPLRGIVAHYLGLEINRYYRLRIDCGSISRLSLRDANRDQRPSPPARLDYLNFTGHLESLRPTQGPDTQEDDHRD